MKLIDIHISYGALDSFSGRYFFNYNWLVHSGIEAPIVNQLHPIIDVIVGG